MKKIIILFIAMVSFAGQAQDLSGSEQATQKKNKNARYTLEVMGNCEQCKKRIEKAALSVSGVKSATWEAESQQLAVIVNEEKTSLAAVGKAVAKVGHDTNDFKASDEAYDALPACCKYERKEVQSGQ